MDNKDNIGGLIVFFHPSSGESEQTTVPQFSEFAFGFCNFRPDSEMVKALRSSVRVCPDSGIWEEHFSVLQSWGHVQSLPCT